MNAGGQRSPGTALLHGDKPCNACEGMSPRSLFAAGVQTLVCRSGAASMTFRSLNPGATESKARLRGPALVKPAAPGKNLRHPAD